jgi:hypothetical protein
MLLSVSLAGFHKDKKCFDLMTKYYFEFGIKYIYSKYEMYIYEMYIYYLKNDAELAEKYYLLSVNKGNVIIVECFGDCCCKLNCCCKLKNNSSELAEKYCLMAIENGYDYALCELGTLYYVVKKYELMEKYYLMAIEKNISDAMYNLGQYYRYIIKNYKLMEKYYLMAIDLKHSTALDSIISYYKNEKNNDRVIKYYLFGIQNNICRTGRYVKCCEKYLNDNLKCYHILSNLENTENNDHLKKTLKRLKNTNEVKCYLNKIKLFRKLNNFPEEICVVCHESNKLHIDLNCGHTLCKDCYCYIDKCYYNCNNNNK